MNKVSSIECDVAESSHSYVGIWPFAFDGLFPSDIFTAEHLHHVVFTVWPLVFSCPVATIRRGLRAHLKRYAPQALKNPHRDQVERDKAMAGAFASICSSRIRAKDISFHMEESVSKFGRSGKKSKVLEVRRSFGELMGHSYHDDSDLRPLFDWFLTCAEPRQEHEEERYLTGALLEKGVFNSDCPVPVDSIEFARMVLLYASLSKTLDEQVVLVDIARSLGCTYLDGLVRNRSDSSHLEEVGMEVQEISVELPSLGSGEPRSRDDWNPDLESLRCVEGFNLAVAAYLKAKDSVAEWQDESVDTLISAADERWKLILASILDARETSKNVSKYRGKLQEQDAAQWKMVLQSVNSEQLWCRKTSANDEELISELLSVSKINAALRQLNPTFNQLEVWKGTLGGMLTLEKLEDLIKRTSVEEGDKFARRLFRDGFNEFVKVSNEASWKKFLLGLTGNELGALVDIRGSDSWVVGDAVLVRAALDKDRTVSNSIMEIFLSADTVERRRALLSFVDPSSPVVHSNLTFRRVVAVERFRDICLFEPVAQVLDPTSGLNDIELVGRNVYEIAELISVNASLLSTGADVSRLIRHSPGDERASAALKEFANAPVSMQGNFRRLKEKAREKLLKVAFKNDEPQPKFVAVLIEDIVSGVFADDMFFELQEERPDDRLEQRHREQLARYVSHMVRLLTDFLSEVQHRPDARLKGVASKLRKLHRQLRTGGASWIAGMA